MYNRCIFINREFGNNRVSRFPGQITEFGQVRPSIVRFGPSLRVGGQSGGRELRCGSVPQQKFITNGGWKVNQSHSLVRRLRLHLSEDWHRISD